MVYFVRTRSGPGGLGDLEVICARGVNKKDSTEIYAEERV